jgi:pyridoxine 5-phosphate synthase
VSLPHAEMLKLGVNVDHVATVRQARRTSYPDVIEAALAAERGGADGITVHLREDRRHIQEEDVVALLDRLHTKLNLEMAATSEMVRIAGRLRPPDVCLVPERREEITTEGGLDVASSIDVVRASVSRLKDAGVRVSLFIDPEEVQIAAAWEIGADVVELHTGAYADAITGNERSHELERLRRAASLAHDRGLLVNAGHGLTLDNVGPIAALPQIEELNIGHSIVARALFVGMEEAAREMKRCMREAREAGRKHPAG